MTDLTPNHPATEAPAGAWRVSDEAEIAASEAYAQGVGERPFSQRMRAAIIAAIPHLTADDLRDTDAADEICTEGWLQGWAAGRDLDGDEDATPYLRDTPAGRALMAEGWREATLWIRYRDGRWPQDMEDANPYREDNA
mgnify:CR=1 FL=1